MDRAEFIKRFTTEYYWLLRNNRALLDKKFPKKSNNNMELLEKRYKKGLDKPRHRVKNEGALNQFIFQKLKKDKNWLKNNFPRWSKTRGEKAIKRMLSSMPKDLVSFKEGQEWKGVNHKHIFICKKYGEFESRPNTLKRRAWKKGLSGHPRNKQRSVKIKETEKIFNSLAECAKSLKVTTPSVSFSLKYNKKCKGYTLEYVDQNET
jgi:hypothetical protein